MNKNQEVAKALDELADLVENDGDAIYIPATRELMFNVGIQGNAVGGGTGVLGEALGAGTGIEVDGPKSGIGILGTASEGGVGVSGRAVGGGTGIKVTGNGGVGVMAVGWTGGGGNPLLVSNILRRHAESLRDGESSEGDHIGLWKNLREEFLEKATGKAAGKIVELLADLVG